MSKGLQGCNGRDNKNDLINWNQEILKFFIGRPGAVICHNIYDSAVLIGPV